MKLQRLLETSWSRIAPQMFEATLKNCKALLPFGDIKFRNETLKLLQMSAAQTDHFDHDCNAWQGGWCPGRLEAKSKDVGRSSNGDRASYLKCHRICTTLYFVGTGPVFLLYFSVLQLNFLACNVLQLNSFCSKVYWQWSKIPFPKQQSLKFHQTAFIFRDFVHVHYTSSPIYHNVCTYLLIKNVYTTSLFCCQAVSNPFLVFLSVPHLDNF